MQHFADPESQSGCCGLRYENNAANVKKLFNYLYIKKYNMNKFSPTPTAENKAFLDLLLNEFYRLLIKLPIE